MKKHNYFFKLLTLLLVSYNAQAITLSGKIGSYPHDSLELFCITNPLTDTYKSISKSAIDSSGHFEFHVDTSTIASYYIPLGSLNAQITLEAKQNIEVTLPDYTPLSSAQRLNPYFEIEKVLIYNEDIKDINYYLTEIEIRQTLWLKDVLASSSPEITAREIQDSVAAYRTTLPNAYTKDYLDIKSVFFKELSSPGQQDIIKENTIRHTAPKLNNPSYMELFKQEYPNPFTAKDGLFYASVSNAILSGHLPKDFITNLGNTHKITNSATAALLCIYGFFEASHIVPQYESQMLSLMEDLEHQIEDPTLQRICKATRMKMKTLCIGEAAPYYELFTPKGKKVPTIIKRRHVMLAFVNTNIFACQRHLRLIEKYKESFKRDLEVVVVACYQDKDEITRFLERNHYEKIYFTLWENNQQLLDDYEIKALPTYCLIDPEGKLMYTQLSSPEEQMLEQLQDIIDIK